MGENLLGDEEKNHILISFILWKSFQFSTSVKNVSKFLSLWKAEKEMFHKHLREDEVNKLFRM